MYSTKVIGLRSIRAGLRYLFPKWFIWYRVQSFALVLPARSNVIVKGEGGGREAAGGEGGEGSCPQQNLIHAYMSLWGCLHRPCSVIFGIMVICLVIPNRSNDGKTSWFRYELTGTAIFCSISLGYCTVVCTFQSRLTARPRAVCMNYLHVQYCAWATMAKSVTSLPWSPSQGKKRSSIRMFNIAGQQNAEPFSKMIIAPGVKRWKASADSQWKAIKNWRVWRWFTHECWPLFGLCLNGGFCWPEGQTTLKIMIIT